MNKLFAYPILFLMVFAISCTKYEEGPKISFLSDSKRLCQQWALVSYYDSSTGETNTNSVEDATEVSTFSEDGTGVTTVSSFLGPVDLSFTCSFIDDTQLEITISGLATSTETITKLSSKELWTRSSNGDVQKFNVKE